MQKLADRYMRDDTMRIRPLHRNKYAYQAGRSLESSLQSIVMRTENALAYKEISLGAFLHIEWAFDRTSFAVITTLLNNMGWNLPS
jgi:hypothetical protein